MRRGFSSLVVLIMIWCCCVPLIGTAASNDAEMAVGAVLDTLHRAASEADGDLYFSLFAVDAVFLGTDAAERWSIEQFKAFAQPYFSKGQGWTYVPGERHVDILPGGSTARFDEILSNEAYGICRGTGVLVLTPQGWRISQYSLSIPIPNDLAKDIVRRIREFDAEAVE
jgi:hypothetical protein